MTFSRCVGIVSRACGSWTGSADSARVPAVDVPVASGAEQLLATASAVLNAPRSSSPAASMVFSLFQTRYEPGEA